MNFVDTNYFLRFLFKDNQPQFAEVEKVFLEAAEGRLKLFTSLLVFFELYWVLASYYQYRKGKIVETLRKILELSFIELDESDILRRSLDVFEENNLDLEDAFNLVLAKGKKADTFKTFDRKLARIWRQFS